MVKISNADKVIIILMSIGLVWGGFWVVGAIRQNRSLSANLTHAEAVVIDDFSTFKFTKLFGYEFSVNGKTYRDKGKYYPSDSLMVGDTVSIVYDSSNPSNGATYRGYVSHQKEKPFTIPILILVLLISWDRARRSTKKQEKTK
jgi:hypothetical protein